MDIVLGVAMAPTTVRMVLVEGEKADGVTVDHDVFDVTAGEDSATTTAADQVVAAILGTQESATSGGHHLKAIGVTWTDHSDAAALRDALSAHGIDDVMLVSESHAAAALAQAVGRAVGYDTTALLFIDRDAATLSVVKTDDGSVVKVLSRSLHSADAMAVLTDMAAAVDAAESAPDGMFVLGAGVDVASVKAHLEPLVSLPVSAPDEPEMALARGAALASANAPAFEATTVGLAYSQDPDGTTAGSAYALAGLATEMAPAGADALGGVDLAADEMPMDGERKPFLLVGSALTSVFVVGVVALVISLAVSIRPTVDQRPAPAQGAVAPTAPAKLPAPAPAPPPEALVPPPPAPPPETIKAPIPVVQEAPAPQAPPRTVYVEQPAAAPPPAPEAPAPAPAPEAPAPAPVPVAPPPAPIYNPPAPYIPPLVVLPPAPRLPNIFRPPWDPPQRQQPWDPPSRHEPQAPKWPGSGSDDWEPPSSGWNPGRGSGDWNPGRSSGSGSGDWNPGGSGSGDWNPGRSGGSRSGGDGGGLWPFPSFGGH
ncbi:hypothetical protein FPV58_04830 [Mycolicibacterium porcinum]|uniref:DUF7159 family protein n=1 Tax=Mycolicibacterium porcinum TaxID=39693 RepID=UPI0011922D5D|nr:hypothetical protein [Mycolicibacterium porcinum]TVY04786.1 hypothetical protein FPV58_04830 [Mycolicibacterium porcinum]